MTESLLQFIWKFQYYNNANLTTTSNEPLQIIKPGSQNTNQGADFLDAVLKINQVLLAGTIELHINTANWTQHKHHTDKNYNNVILHVVWIDNRPTTTNSNFAPIATLELQPLVSKILLSKYQQLSNSPQALPCAAFLPALSSIGWTAWKERLVAERLFDKSNHVLQLLQSNNNNWEETFWQMLAHNFGLKVNANLFLQMAQNISLNVLAKHKNQIHQIEALLLGQVNLLNEDFENDYPKLLQKEYLFLKKKYQLKNIAGNAHFLRMRPSNFPTIRLAQLAMLITQSSHLFSKIKEAVLVKDVTKHFVCTCNDYWHYHYTLTDEPSNYKPKMLGKATVDAIVINTLCSVLFAYGSYMNEEDYKQKAINWLQQIAAEQNSVTKVFTQNNLPNKSAFDSQAYLQLYKNYCTGKHCLQCSVGNKILKIE